jgi:hypothetical protein
MNNSKTPKIVIGVGLVAVYATGMAVFALRGKHDNVIAQSPPAAVSAPMAAAPAAPPLVSQESANTSAFPEASAPAAMPAPIAPAVANTAKAAEATRPSVASQPKPRAAEVPVESLPSPRPPAASDVEELNRSNSGSNAVSELAAAETVTGESVTSEEDTSSDEDSQSTEAPAVDNSDQ